MSTLIPPAPYSTPESAAIADDTHPYVYVLIRKDLELHQQLVQSSHAAFEAGLRWHSPGAEVASLIVLEVPHKAALLRAARKFTGLGIVYRTRNRAPHFLRARL